MAVPGHVSDRCRYSRTRGSHDVTGEGDDESVACRAPALSLVRPQSGRGELAARAMPPEVVDLLATRFASLRSRAAWTRGEAAEILKHYLAGVLADLTRTHRTQRGGRMLRRD